MDLCELRQVFEQAGRIEAFTMANMCTVCHLMPKDDFVWRKSSGASIHCAFSGGQSKAKMHVLWLPRATVTAWTLSRLQCGVAPSRALQVFLGCSYLGEQRAPTRR